MLTDFKSVYGVERKYTLREKERHADPRFAIEISKIAMSIGIPHRNHKTSNAEMASLDKAFRSFCDDANEILKKSGRPKITPNKRQASKFRNHYGLAFRASQVKRS